MARAEGRMIDLDGGHYLAVKGDPADPTKPKWQRGYAIEQLRPFAQLFKAAYEPYTHGAFGMPKELDVAMAAESRELLWAGDETEPTAVIIAHYLRTPSTHTDFAGRTVRIPAGDVLVHHLAPVEWHREEQLKDLLAALMVQTAHLAVGAIWVEAHVENRALARILKSLGFVYLMTKVMASSDLRGLWVRGRSAQVERLDPADALSLSLLSPDLLSSNTMDRIRTELFAAQDDDGLWAQHYSGYNKGKSWTAFSLYGYDRTDPSFIIKPSEMSKKWKAENPARMADTPGFTPLAKYFPITLAVVGRLAPGWERIRFMKLRATDGELTRHADITNREAGTQIGAIGRFHIPIVSRGGVTFKAWDAYGRLRAMDLHEGSLYYLDQRKPHAVTNRGEEDRIHLVMDLVMDEPLRDRLREAARREHGATI